MPHGCRDAYQIDDEDNRIQEFALDDAERGICMRGYGSSIESRNQTEAEVENVKGNKEKQDNAGDALNQVKPISGIRVGKIIGSRLDCDHQAIDGVVDERYKDSANLD